MSTNTLMDHRHLKVGDKVVLTGGEWDKKYPGLEPLLGSVVRVKDVSKHQAIVNDPSNTRALAVCEGWPCILVERDGKKVTSVLVGGDTGYFRVEYEDGTREGFTNADAWGPSMIPHYSNETYLDLAGSTWVEIYPLASTPIDPTDEQIDAALAVLKKNRGLCGTFDRAVKEAQAAPTYLERLKTVAQKYDRPDLYTALEEALAPEKPEKPKKLKWNKGDTVRLIGKDTTHTLKHDVYEGDKAFNNKVFDVTRFERVKWEVY